MSFLLILLTNYSMFSDCYKLLIRKILNQVLIFLTVNL